MLFLPPALRLTTRLQVMIQQALLDCRALEAPKRRRESATLNAPFVNRLVAIRGSTAAQRLSADAYSAT